MNVHLTCPHCLTALDPAKVEVDVYVSEIGYKAVHPTTIECASCHCKTLLHITTQIRAYNIMDVVPRT